MRAVPLALLFATVLVVGCGDDGSDGSGSAHPATLLWENLYDGGVGGSRLQALAYSVAVCGSRVFVVGEARSDDDTASAWLVRAHDAADGTLLWEDRYAAGGYGQARRVGCDAERVYVAGEGELRAYSSSDGNFLWSRINGDRTPNSYWALEVDRGTVFWFATGVYGSGGTTLTTLRALDPDGAMLWENATEVESPQGWGFGGIGASATMVCVGWDDFIGTVARTLRCLDRRTGDPVWEKAFNNDRARGSSLTPSFSPDVSIVAFAGTERGNSFLAGYRARDGRLQWKRRYESPVDLARPGARDSDFFVAGVEYVGDEPTNTRDVFFVSALDARTGDVKWEDRRFDEQPGGLAVEGARVIAVGVRWESRVYRADGGALLIDEPLLGSSLANDVATENGRYFVVGSRPSASGDADFAVRAYSAR